MTKVMLPHDVATSLEFLKNELGEEILFKFEIMISHYKKSNKYKKPIQSHINTIVNYAKNNPNHRETYYKALVNGYECELSKEEKLIQLSEEIKDGIVNDDQEYNLGRRDAMKDVLNILKVEIDGVDFENSVPKFEVGETIRIQNNGVNMPVEIVFVKTVKDSFSNGVKHLYSIKATYGQTSYISHGHSEEYLNSILLK